jgi:hypothetical protein
MPGRRRITKQIKDRGEVNKESTQRKRKNGEKDLVCKMIVLFPRAHLREINDLSKSRDGNLYENLRIKTKNLTKDLLLSKKSSLKWKVKSLKKKNY